MIQMLAVTAFRDIVNLYSFSGFPAEYGEEAHLPIANNNDRCVLLYAWIYYIMNYNADFTVSLLISWNRIVVYSMERVDLLRSLEIFWLLQDRVLTGRQKNWHEIFNLVVTTLLSNLRRETVLSAMVETVLDVRISRLFRLLSIPFASFLSFKVQLKTSCTQTLQIQLHQRFSVVSTRVKTPASSMFSKLSRITSSLMKFNRKSWKIWSSTQCVPISMGFNLHRRLITLLKFLMVPQGSFILTIVDLI